MANVHTLFGLTKMISNIYITSSNCKLIGIEVQDPVNNVQFFEHLPCFICIHFDPMKKGTPKRYNSKKFG